MKKSIQLVLIQLAFLIFLLMSGQLQAQTTNTLRQKIGQIIASKKAVVGVSISGENGKDTLSINGTKHLPMQSVFKFPIALTMLSEIDKGHFALDQKVEIKKAQLLPGLWSPIREKYPEGVTLTIAEIMQYIITYSDNVGCDVMLKLLGKPEVVETYFARNGFKDIAVKINEETMQNNWDLQFLNWTTPNEANKILEAFYNNKNNLLSKESHDFIWKTMSVNQTGKMRLPRQLPEGTVVAHKTGTSGVNKKTGITAALNDIGVISLPNGKHFFISVFVTDSKESTETNEKIISDIAKVTWDYFTCKQ